MKKLTFLTLVLTSALIISACNNNANEHAGHDMSKMDSNKDEHASAPKDTDFKTTSVTFKDVDAKAAASIKEIVDHYLHIKNALAKDDANEAAKGGSALAEAVSKLDKSLLSPDQKKIFDSNEEDLKEHGEHINKNSNNIKHQREHFVGMSEDVYALVKAFGGGRELYHDHCPMAQENKGAMWISEVKEIKNPYFGAEMPTCGSVEEVIK